MLRTRVTGHPVNTLPFYVCARLLVGNTYALKHSFGSSHDIQPPTYTGDAVAGAHGSFTSKYGEC